MPLFLHGLGGIFENIEKDLLKFAGLTGHLGQALLIMADHLNGSEVILFFQIIVASGQLQGLVQDLGDILGALPE